MNKRRFTWFLMLLLIVTVAVSMWIWWSAQAGPYAYTVISEYDRLEGHMSHRIRSINSFAVTVDLGSGEVIDTFPIDIRVPMRIRLDPTGQELYVTGSEGHPEEISRDHWSAESPQWEDIHVYDVRTGKLARTIKLPEDADGSVRGMSITPDGNRLYISNPYENVEDAPTVEKQKRRWALDPQTGEFLFGFDVSPGTYLTNDGNKGFFKGQTLRFTFSRSETRLISMTGIWAENNLLENNQKMEKLKTNQRKCCIYLKKYRDC